MVWQQSSGSFVQDARLVAVNQYITNVNVNLVWIKLPLFDTTCKVAVVFPPSIAFVCRTAHLVNLLCILRKARELLGALSTDT